MDPAVPRKLLPRFESTVESDTADNGRSSRPARNCKICHRVEPKPGRHHPDMSATPRFHQIDFLRGLACLAVIAFHFLHRGQAGGWLTEPTWQWLQPLAALGHLGVHLFFIISGFVILMTARGATVRSFVASRVSRLYPAFWVGVLLTWLVAWATHSERFAVTPGQALVNLTMVPQWVQIEFVDGAYWSLAVELQFYLMVIALLYFGQMRRVETWMAVWLVIASVNAVRGCTRWSSGWMRAGRRCSSRDAVLPRQPQGLERPALSADAVVVFAVDLVRLAGRTGVATGQRARAAGPADAGGPVPDAVPPGLPGHRQRTTADAGLAAGVLVRGADLPGLPAAPRTSATSR